MKECGLLSFDLSLGNLKSLDTDFIWFDWFSGFTIHICSVV